MSEYDNGDEQIAGLASIDLAEAEAAVVGEERPGLPDESPAAPPYDDTPYPADEQQTAHPFDPRARFKRPHPEWLDQATKAARALPFVFDGLTNDRAAFDNVEAHKGPQLRAALEALIDISTGYNADVLLDAYAAMLAVLLVDAWFNASHSTALNALAVSQFQLHSLFHQMIAGAEAALAQNAMQEQLNEIFDRMAAQAAEEDALRRFPGAAGLPN